MPKAGLIDADHGEAAGDPRPVRRSSAPSAGAGGRSVCDETTRADGDAIPLPKERPDLVERYVLFEAQPRRHRLNVGAERHPRHTLARGGGHRQPRRRPLVARRDARRARCAGCALVRPAGCQPRPCSPSRRSKRPCRRSYTPMASRAQSPRRRGPALPVSRLHARACDHAACPTRYACLPVAMSAACAARGSRASTASTSLRTFVNFSRDASIFRDFAPRHACEEQRLPPPVQRFVARASPDPSCTGRSIMERAILVRNEDLSHTVRCR